jgi:uncharacterized protein (DUF302 family)
MIGMPTLENNPKIPYGFCRTLNVPLGTAIETVKAALKLEGFGVLFDLDLREQFKEKLGVDFKKYSILGVCNPATAYKALREEIGLGLLLPCNVIVYEDHRQSVVAFIDPTKLLSLVGNPELAPLAKEISIKLRRALDSL